MLDPEKIIRDISTIRSTAPLVHNITNFVVMNTTANALLALGASPVMAHAPEEMVEMTGIASALVLNIGTLSKAWIDAMHLAASTATTRKIPVVVDPVGAGATSFRTDTVAALIKETPPTVIRGNGSEILATAAAGSKTKGVDSTVNSGSALNAAALFAAASGTVISISGETDYITDGTLTLECHNGVAMMTKVTGMGCTASALTGAFCAVNSDPLEAAAHAMAVMGICGELAAEKAAGPATLQLHFIDALYNLTDDCIRNTLR